MNVLPDTSVWITFFREGEAGAAAELGQFLRSHTIFTCGPVVAELLVGTQPDKRADVWAAVGEQPWAELDHGGWRRAGEVGHGLRRQGVTIPLTDVLIAVAALEVGAAVWSLDRDFERIRRVLPELTLYRPR